MAIASFGYTNSSQIINNTVINTTLITKGYAYDDVTISNLSSCKPKQYHYPSNFDVSNLNFDNILSISGESYYKTPYKEINFEDTTEVLFNITTKMSGQIVNLPTTNSIYLRINGIDYLLERYKEYWQKDIPLYVGQQLHIEVGSNEDGYFPLYGTFTTDYTVTQELLDGLIPTIHITLELYDNAHRPDV